MENENSIVVVDNGRGRKRMRNKEEWACEKIRLGKLPHLSSAAYY